MMGIMLPMIIKVKNVTLTDGTIRATVHVRVQEIGAHARIALQFEPEPDSGPAQWKEEAYSRALMMLDPA